MREQYLKDVERYDKEKDEISEKAKELESERALVSRREDRYDAAEVILEIALIICSLTLLTKKRLFWFAGILVGLFGVVAGVSGHLMH